ncbi:MAG TPA: pseudouridine synthase [Nitrospira sp.]
MKENRTGVARALSKMGYCSRTQATQLVRAGKVALNGRIIRDPESPVRLEKDSIQVDGAPISEPPKIYLAMNKPRGLVTTTSDERGRATVYEILNESDLPSEEARSWVAAVGRLDRASEGLLLFTNDSEWAARITDPRSHLPKTYHVQIGCVAAPQLLDQIRRGVETGGEFLSAQAVTILRHGSKTSWLEITLDEGKNRHIRRLLAAFGVEVLRLVRVAIGPLELGDLRKGTSRPLTLEEKEIIDRALSES